MSATIIRLKRPLTEDSIDTFLVDTKRRKLDVNNKSSTIFNFIGTSSSRDDVFEHIKNTRKKSITRLHNANNSFLMAKLREKCQNNSKNNRFKVVNSIRLANDTASIDSNCTIVDVECDEQSITTDEPKTSEGFMYDFYTTNESHENYDLYEDALENVLSVCPVSKEMFDIRDDLFPSDDDSDDSNAENYFANDYPDEYENSDEEVRSDEEVKSDEDVGNDEETISDDDEETKQFSKYFNKFTLDECDYYSDYEEHSDNEYECTPHDCEEYDDSCTP